MQHQKTAQLYDKHAAVDYYQERYTHGYMNEWSIEKKQRICEIIRTLGLPGVGEALDYGCGNGVFTNVIKQALPCGWKVYGTDISAIAIENAEKRYPECNFFAAGDSKLLGRRFDFVFTHHVLEHVYNLSLVLNEIKDFLKDNASVLHILPCGNEGSFEYRICLLRKDGMNPKLENRFFFEDEGHVRRLTTEQLNTSYREMGFVLAKEYYSNQYYGAINWITQYGSALIRLLTDTSSASGENSKKKLIMLRYKLIFIWALRYPATYVEGKLPKRGRTFRDYLFLTLGLLLYVFSRPMDSYLKNKALEEWRKRKTERNGSEMYLFFKKN